MQNRSDTEDRVKRVKELTRKLKAVNTEMGHMLDQLPIVKHQDLYRLQMLLKWQEKLIRMPIKKVPVAIAIFLDNEINTAQYLKTRYKDALSRGKIKRFPTP